MNSNDKRFVGVYTATAITLNDDFSINYDRFAEHCAWQASEGAAGVVPNGSLGEYEAFSDEERAKVVEVAVQATSGSAEVVAGVSGKSAAEAVRWTEQAAAAGCAGVMCLPPTSHAPTTNEMLAHFEAVAAVGMPVIAYNNPFSTRIDLVPELAARLAEIDGIVAIKEFSGDIRRVAHIKELAPDLQIMAGSDDVLVEEVFMGATGWIAGFSNAFPSQSVHLFNLCLSGDWEPAKALYREMLPIMRWDADPRFVQAIKLALVEAGRYGGPVRLPRLPLSAEDEKTVIEQTHRALKATV